RKPRDMSWQEMRRRRTELVDEIEQTTAEIGLNAGHDVLGKGAQQLPLHLSNLRERIADREVNIRGIDTEMHMRPALAFGCLFFVLVGCPVGIWLSKSDYLSAFITCFLPIVVVYYPLLFLTINLARAGRFPPWVSIYTADVLMLIAGAVLLRKLARK